jgi:EAL domain-containing protein (putative c-di-GMP-specific phosphodiesterase class I)/AmiR/NasT family two-component response regulator
MSTVDGSLLAVAECRVLVVDDNPANTQLVRRILERAGLSTVREENDPRAVPSSLDGVDLVVLDLRMPQMDGFAVLEQIHRFAGISYLPVIVVTADDSHASIERALELGAHDYVRKPFNARELIFRVRNLLIARSANMELRRSRALLSARLDVFEPAVPDVEADGAAVRRLLESVVEGGIRLALQPIVRIAGAPTVGVEALSRFPANERLANPATWFAAAHRAGLTVELESAACRSALRLLPTLGEGMFLAVNVSPDLLLSGELDRLDHSVQWSRVVIELTEHEPVEDYAAMQSALAALREQGARLAVDDAGAGFASLRHILDLHPDVIKIDIDIIRGVDRDPGRAAIADMLVRFAERMGAEVVAEGIETADEQKALMDIGDMWAQGYLFGRPEVRD